MKSRVIQPRRSERGQSLVEFALTAVMLVTVLMGVVDLARAYFTYLALKDAAQEGTYFGAVFPRCQISTSVASNRCADPNNITYRVRQSAPTGGLVDWSAALVTPCAQLGACSNVSNIKTGDLLTVTVSYSYTLLTPVIGGIVGSQTLLLSAQSVAVVVVDKLP